MNDENVPIQPPLARHPEPMAVATVCVGTLAMAGTIVNVFVNYRKYVRDREVRQDDAIAAFLVKTDALRVAGERLLDITNSAGERGIAAFRMTDFLRAEAKAAPSSSLSLRAGETALEVPPEGRGRWDELVEDTARGVDAMNKAIAGYEDIFSDLLGSGSRLEQILHRQLGSLIGNVVNNGIGFRKALDSYQNLRAGSAVVEAEERFNRLRFAANDMVEAANGFARLTIMFLKLKRDERSPKTRFSSHRHH